jgi:hypothetical protein
LAFTSLGIDPRAFADACTNYDGSSGSRPGDKGDPAST